MESAKNRLRLGKQPAGFSVVELLIATAIGLIVLGMVSVIYFSSSRSYTSGQTKLQSEADLRLAMDYITRDMRAAESLSPDTVTLTIPTDTVTITIPLGSGSEDSINYDFSDNQLRRNQKPIASVSMRLARSSTTDDTVTITLYSTAGGTIQALTTAVHMRNVL